MPRILSDNEIAELLAERKELPEKWQSRLQLRAKSHTQHSERDLLITGEAGHTFRVVLRQSKMNPLDFSIILLYVDDDGTSYCLTRFNGRHSSGHTNRIEKSTGIGITQFRDVFHIHLATERYQRTYGRKSIDEYAEPTEKYGSFDTALDAFLMDNGIIMEGGRQLEIGLDGGPGL